MADNLKIMDRVVLNQVFGEQPDQTPRIKKLLRNDKRPPEKKGKKQRDRVSVVGQENKQ